MNTIKTNYRSKIALDEQQIDRHMANYIVCSKAGNLFSIIFSIIFI